MKTEKSVTKKTTTNQKIDLVDLTEKIVDNLEIVLNALGLCDYNVYNTRFTFPCPIHCGDNPEGCCIFTEGDEKVGNWVCWTHGCHEENNSLLEFIRLNLSTTHEASFSETIAWCIKLLNCDVNNIGNIQCHDFIKLNRKMSSRSIELAGTHTRDHIRKYLDIPAEFYLDRGFTPEILDKYDVGLCRVPRNKMYLRVVSPVYDDNYRFLGGCGRTIQPQCSKCKYYHYPNRRCPENELERMWGSKWLNSSGQFAGHTFYNSWFAIPHIFKSGAAILVEGCGDVWRLEEADIHLGLGMFKTRTTESQDEILKRYPISHLILATDGDKAGIEGKESLIEKYSRYYNIHEVNLSGDVADMCVEETKDVFYPILDKIGAR